MGSVKAFWRSFFGKSPRIGDVMVLDYESTPWGRPRDTGTVTVIDVREGWVRYKLNGSTVFTDERMRISSFRFCYVSI